VRALGFKFNCRFNRQPPSGLCEVLGKIPVFVEAFFTKFTVEA
jgi:hypothetical protein